jgi:hypothetical protein
VAAWKHYAYWTEHVYDAKYRKYVMHHAARYEGDTNDCADLSLILLIEFAAANGLPLTFSDNAGVAAPHADGARKMGFQDVRTFLRHRGDGGRYVPPSVASNYALMRP